MSAFTSLVVLFLYRNIPHRECCSQETRVSFPCYKSKSMYPEKRGPIRPLVASKAASSYLTMTRAVQRKCYLERGLQSSGQERRGA